METRRCRERVKQNIINFPVYAFAKSYSFSSILVLWFHLPYDSSRLFIQFVVKYDLSVTHVSERRIESGLVLSKLFLSH